MLDLLAHGLGAHDAALASVRIGAGVFFAISGGNKLFVASRHASLRDNLERNRIPFLKFMEWWVPFWEFVAGLMLAIGLLTAFSAAVLLIICLVACHCEAREKVAKYQPINRFDTVADYLYLPEVLFVLMLLVNILAGAGAYSLDSFLF